VKLHGIAAEVLGDEKLTRTGIVHGTPTYMAPEQALARPIDGRADLYAVGLLIFEMLVGKPPFEGDEAVKVMRRHIAEPPPLLRDRGLAWATPELEALIGGALAKRPTERFTDAAAMIAALDQAFLSIQ
jgi:serine/threonine protein kinase